MRSCKECLQQSLPINIFARLVVSKISKHKSYKFGLWKISYYILCIEVKRAPKRADPGLGKMMCLSNYYMQPAYDPVRGPLSVLFFGSQYNECQRLCHGKTKHVRVHDAPDQNSFDFAVYRHI